MSPTVGDFMALSVHKYTERLHICLTWLRNKKDKFLMVHVESFQTSPTHTEKRITGQEKKRRKRKHGTLDSSCCQWRIG